MLTSVLALLPRRRAFVPTSIPTLALWLKSDAGLYDATSNGSAVTTDGAAVARWEDQSGNTRHMTQTTADSRPTLQNGATDTLNGRGVILFDGTDDCLKTGLFTFDQPFTVFLVLNQVTWAGNDVILAGAVDETDRILQVNASPNIGLYYGNFDGFRNGELLTANWGLVRAVVNGATSAVAVNGNTAVSGDAGSVGSNGLCLGARPTGAAAANIKLAEVLVFSGTLTAGQTAQVESYLNSRWRLWARNASFYVDATGGDDSNDGLTTATAWQTLSQVNASAFQPGDSIYLKRGETWAETLTPPSNGMAAYPITFGAYGSGARPVINGGDARNYGINATARTHLQFDDLEVIDAVLSCFQFSGGTHTVNRCVASGSGDQNVQNDGASVVTYNDCTMSGAADEGVSIHATAQVTLNRCTVSGNTQGLDTSTTGASATLTGCTFSGNTTDNILADANCALVVNRSYFGHCASAGHNIEVAKDGCELNHCLFDVSGANELSDGLVNVNTASVTLAVNNCTFYGGAGGYGGVVAGVSGATINFTNCVFLSVWRVSYIETGAAVNADYCLFNTVSIKSLTTNTNELTTDPLFVDAAAGNFHLQAASPCRNSGTDVGLTTDYDGVSIPQETVPARGAFEYVA